MANDNESRVPQPPKPEPKRAIKEPDLKALPLKSRLAIQRALREESQQRYHPQPPQPNQVFSSKAPAAVSPMFEKPGSGGVGVGPNSVFGNRFGAYADLVVKRVTEKWQTAGLLGVHTAPVVIVTFDILRDGSIRNPQIAQRSGNSTLDYSALRAVHGCSTISPASSRLRAEARPTSNSDFNYSDETNYFARQHCSGSLSASQRSDHQDDHQQGRREARHRHSRSPRCRRRRSAS